MLGKNKYSRLLGNTLLFGISSMSAKVLSFLLTRLHTDKLSPEQYGAANLVVQFAWLIIPLVSLGIANAVIRFGLEKGVSKSGVFTGGLAAIGIGFAIALLLAPLVRLYQPLRDYLFLAYVYVLVSCLRNMFSQFVRAKMQIKLYAIDGLLTTVYTLGFNILFLVVLDMGAVGYLLSVIAADLLSSIGLFIMSSLWKYIDFRHFDRPLFKTMLGYSLPLVPAAVFWWINSSSDAFFIQFIMGTSAYGLYHAAARVPHLISMFSTIFTEAWQLSAVSDGQDSDKANFFSTIYNALEGLCFIGGAGLILLCQLVMRFLVNEEFFGAWRYIPFLVMAIIFSTLAIFLNSVYMVERKSKLSLYTMMVGAAVNVVLNIVLINWIGLNGAALATLISYLVVYVLRAVNTRNFIRIKFNPFKIILNTLLLFLQSLVLIAELNNWQLWCGLILAAVVLVNGYSLYQGFLQLVQRRKKSGK